MAISEQQATSPYVGRRMSLDEFLMLPEQEPALEFADGVVTQKVSPKRKHGRGQYKLAEAFGRAGEDSGLGLVYTETRFKTPTWAPVPDIVFYVWDRLATLPEDADEDFDVPPDIAVEISSPDQSLGELIQKCIRYTDVGVRISVLVAVNDRSVFVFRPSHQGVVLRGGERIDLADILPDFELTVDELFALILPAPPHPGGRPK